MNSARSTGRVLGMNLKLALQNIVRQPARSIIPLCAVIFGVVALVLAMGFIEWIYYATREGAIHSELGHLQVVRPHYYESGLADPSKYLLPDSLEQRAAIARIPGVKTVAPRLQLSGLISAGETTATFIGEGVDPDREKDLISVRLTGGNNLSTEAPFDIIAGEGLARHLGVKPGQTIVLMANTQRGGINAIEGKVRGLFSTPSKAYDDTAIRMLLPAAQQLLRVSGSHKWVILLRETTQTDNVRALLRAQLPEQAFELVPWYTLSDFYNKMRALFEQQVNVLKIIIGFIIVLSISNSFMMNVLERTAEIGTSMALGATRRTILGRFLTEGMLLGVLGGLIGVSLGALLGNIISYYGIPMPPPPGMEKGYSGEILVTAEILGGAFVLAFSTALLACIYPAWKASSLKIVDALRYSK
jgi:putative ABC transport system permease protein